MHVEKNHMDTIATWKRSDKKDNADVKNYKKIKLYIREKGGAIISRTKITNDLYKNVLPGDFSPAKTCHIYLNSRQAVSPPRPSPPKKKQHRGVRKASS